MVTFGYQRCYAAEDPVSLLDTAKRAEKAGFDAVWIADHFHPHFHTNAQCGFAWTWLGAAGAYTEKVTLGTRVSAPLGRYHPGIIAQAFATLDYMFPGRIVLGLGTGEAMNVRPLGHDWPKYPERLERLRESLQIIRELWKKEFVDYAGEYYMLETANLYTKPKDISIYVGAKGPKAALIAGKYADGIDTTSDRNTLQNLILPSVRKGLRETNRRPESIKMSTSFSCSYDKEYEKAFHSARKEAPWLHPNIYSMEIWDPREIEKLGADIPPSKIQENFCINTEAENIIQEIQRLLNLRFDHIVVNDVSPKSKQTIDLFSKQILPHFRNGK